MSDVTKLACFEAVESVLGYWLDKKELERVEVHIKKEESNLDDAFVWQDAKQGYEFWGLVYMLICQKPPKYWDGESEVQVGQFVEQGEVLKIDYINNMTFVFTDHGEGIWRGFDEIKPVNKELLEMRKYIAVGDQDQTLKNLIAAGYKK